MIRSFTFDLPQEHRANTSSKLFVRVQACEGVEWAGQVVFDVIGDHTSVHTQLNADDAFELGLALIKAYRESGLTTKLTLGVKDNG